MSRICIGLIVICFVAAGCESNKPPQTTRIQISDIEQVTGAMTTKLASSDFMRERTSASAPMVITCRKAENLSHDLVEEPELWVFVQKVQADLNAGNFSRAKNIIWQIPPERVEMLRKSFPDVASSAEPATHYMTASIRSATRVSNDKEGYVDSETRLYYFDYTITRMQDGKLEWSGSAEFKRKAVGRLGD